MAGTDNNSDNNTNKSGKNKTAERIGLLSILLIFLCLFVQWAYKYYKDNPLKFPWGSQVYTVSANDIELLPNEQLNYLGARVDQDDETEFHYHANNMYLTASAAFSIRSGPGVYYHSIGRMYYGRSVHVLATCDENDWYLIDFYGEEAYVHSACLFEKLPEITNTEETDIIIRGSRSNEEIDTLNTGETEEVSETDVTEPTEEVVETTATAETTEAVESSATEPIQATEPTATPTPAATATPTPAPAVSAPSDPTMLELFNLVNDARVQNGLEPLSWNSALAADAAVRATEISVVFSHTRPDGSDWWTVDSDRMYGENIASGQSTAQEVFNSWWASPGHQANILGNYTTCGFALYYGGDAGSTYYWVQEFGY